MTSDWRTVLCKHFSNRPLVIIRFSYELSTQLRETRHWPQKFSFAQPHAAIAALKVPALCLVYTDVDGDVECTAGVVKSKAAITTVDSRLSVRRAVPIRSSSVEELIGKIANKRFKNLLKAKADQSGAVVILSEKLSVHVIDALSQHEANRGALLGLSETLQGFETRSVAYRTQQDAIGLALRAFGIGKAETAVSLSAVENTDSALACYGSNEHLIEDNVIAHDARSIPGFDLIKSDLTGRAVFERADEQLEVFTANRGDLESMLGVDLIYVNTTRKNIVMVQYKMLERNKPDSDDDASQDWVFRPDAQFQAEKDRMVLLREKASSSDYRLNADPFFFKFVKREPAGTSLKGLVLPLEHLEMLLKSNAAKGPKGGTRISYNVLDGRYLRESEFLALISAGYIGTHSDDTEHLRAIIAEAASGNKSVVLAWQQKKQQTAPDE